MSGKRYFTRNENRPEEFTLDSGLHVLAVPGALRVFSQTGEFLFALMTEEAIGLGMIAQQIPGHVVTRGGARRT